MLENAAVAALELFSQSCAIMNRPKGRHELMRVWG